MDEWQVKIKKVTNGYILAGRFGNSEYSRSLVLEEKDTADELLVMKELLQIIKDYFGIYYSDHNKENLIIGIETNAERE